MAADQANDYKKVVRIFRQIVKEDPENAGMLNNLGELQNGFKMRLTRRNETPHPGAIYKIRQTQAYH